MAHAFDRFVFYQASAADRERIHALQTLHPRLTSKYTIFSDSLAEIEALAPGDLFVCCTEAPHNVWRHVAEVGHVSALSSQEFLTHAPQIMALQTPAVFGEVVLAFLPDLLRRQAMRLFSLFGFNPVAVDSTPTLMRELKHGASLVVFDQDMPGHKNRVHESREKIFSLLRAERRRHRQLAVVIIKDFDQGSLFGDMMTMAKDVSNAMLSPTEFLEFIRNYLADFHTSHATWKLKVGAATGLAQATYTGRPSAYLGLADVKNSFQIFQDKSYNEFMHARAQMLVEANDLAVRMAVTEWLFEKDLTAEVTSGKNLLIKSEVPRVFERPAPQIYMPENETPETPAQDTMFN